jgi:hypothetical protein
MALPQQEADVPKQGRTESPGVSQSLCRKELNPVWVGMRVFSLPTLVIIQYSPLSMASVTMVSRDLKILNGQFQK